MGRYVMIVSAHEHQSEREAFSKDGLNGEAYVARLPTVTISIWRFLCRAPTSLFGEKNDVLGAWPDQLIRFPTMLMRCGRWH